MNSGKMKNEKLNWWAASVFDKLKIYKMSNSGIAAETPDSIGVI